jgi:hypothetical protein
MTNERKQSHAIAEALREAPSATGGMSLAAPHPSLYRDTVRMRLSISQSGCTDFWIKKHPRALLASRMHLFKTLFPVDSAAQMDQMPCGRLQEKCGMTEEEAHRRDGGQSRKWRCSLSARWHCVGRESRGPERSRPVRHAFHTNELLSLLPSSELSSAVVVK